MNWTTLFLWVLEAAGLKNAREIAETIQSKATKKNYIFKDSAAQIALLETLEILTKNIQSLNATCCGRLISLLLACNDKHEMLNALRVLKALDQLIGNLGDLQEIVSLQELDVIFKKKFFENIPLQNIPYISEKFTAFLQSFRNPAAIVNYAGALMSLKEKPQLIEQFLFSIQDELENRFLDVRYEGSTHLQTIFQARPDLAITWRQGKKQNLGEVMDKDHKNDPHLDSNIDFFELFLGYFQEGHALKEDFPFLAGYLSTKTPESKEAIKRELTDKLKDKALGINEKKSLQFQNQLIVLSKVKDSKEGLLLLKKALAYFPGPDSQFKHDLINLSENVKNRDAQKEENNYQGWSVVDSDDFCDLLLCGTEVESCQRASGDPNFNKCLLAYIVDGKNRLIAIKDEKGVIKARSIFRLLWSQESKTPILFLDRIYPDVLNRQLKNVLTNFALQRAEHLNVSLATKQIESNQTVKVPTLYSLGGKAQYEYVDALERGQEGSKWAINGAFLL